MCAWGILVNLEPLGDEENESEFSNGPGVQIKPPSGPVDEPLVELLRR